MDLRQGWRLALAAGRAWADDYAPSMGAALSYYALFSVAPLALILVGVAGFFFGEQAARGELFDELNLLVGADAAHVVQGLLANARRPASGVLAMAGGAALLLAGASTVFGELQNALDRIWRAPEDALSKGWWRLVRARAVSFAMIVVLALLLIASLALSTAVAALAQGWALHVADLAASLALMTLAFAIVYKVIPRVQTAWRDVWIGAAVTAALFAAGKLAIGLYLGRSGVASAFGAAGSLVALLVWLYYSAQIFLFGAEFTRLYAEQHGSRTRAKARLTVPIRVQPAANSPLEQAPGRGGALAKLGAALALGVGASIGLRFWRRR